MVPILLDYETLRCIWWVALGILLIGFAIMDGFDMGVAFLNPLIGNTDIERRIILNTIKPVWEGNQVWLILAAGSVFAAFPTIYATAFSSFYIAMLLLLLSLIVRPVSLEFRDKFDISKRKYWDYALFTSGLVPPLIFGVVFGNLFQGVPFFFDEMHVPHYVSNEGISGYFGGFFLLLNPFGLFCGLISLAMLTTHGAIYLAVKTQGIIRVKATKVIYIGLAIWFILFAVGYLWVEKIEGFVVTHNLDSNAPSNPLVKEVVRSIGVWNKNYLNYPILYTIPLLAFINCFITAALIFFGYRATAFISSSLMIAGTIVTAGIALFPFMLTSSHTPSHSLILWDSTSSHLTLWLMALATVLFMPLIIIYTSWVYRVLRRPLTEELVEETIDSLY